MNESIALAETIAAPKSGPAAAQHGMGKPILNVMNGLDLAEATWRCGDGAKTIWEIVRHMTFWVERPHRVAERRIHRQRRSV